MPSDEEIRRVRRLITRVSEDLGDLGEEYKTQILDADRRYLREPPDSAGGGFRCTA